MMAQKKRHGGEAVAPEAPENPSPHEEAHVQNLRNSALEALSEFPPSAWKASADWHRERANRARSAPELKHHLRMWAIRWAFWMRSIQAGWADYATAVFASSIAASGLRVRFRVKDIHRLCREINRVVWGEG